MAEDLADWYRKRRKNVNENLGLLIALAACGAAMWTGYEARHARLEAASIADQSLKVQHESVQAQITALRFDERPYMRVATVGVKPSDKEDPDDDYQAVFKLVAIGRTPATFLHWNVYCGVLDANQITGVAQTEREARARALPDSVMIILAETSLTSATSNEAVLNNGESIQVDCPFSRKDYKSGKDDVEIDTDKQFTNDKSTMMTFIIDVAYSDVFDSTHKTQQCFYVPTGESPIHAKLLSCRKYKAVIE
jgi:hypothetical protein